MNDLEKLDSLRSEGILSEDAYWDARSRLLSPEPQLRPRPRPLPMTSHPAGIALAPEPTVVGYFGAPAVGFDTSVPARHRARTKRRWPLIVAGVAVVVLAAAGVGTYVALTSSEETVTVNGKFSLEDAATAKADCVGQGENSGLGAGTAVKLFGTDATLLGETKLRTGERTDDTCVFAFSFRTVSKTQPEYSVAVANMPRTSSKREDLADGDWTFSLRQGPPSGDLDGSLTLSDSDTADNECVGTFGYDDIDEGTEVVVRDQDNRVLGSGYLEAGIPQGGGECSYSFSIADVRRDQEQYSVEVAHRGQVTNSRSDMDEAGWSFGLTLGA